MTRDHINELFEGSKGLLNDAFATIRAALAHKDRRINELEEYVNYLEDRLFRLTDDSVDDLDDESI